MLLPLEGQGDVEHPNKLTFACYAAAVLSELLLKQRDSFGLTLLSDGIDLQTDTHSSRVHQKYLLEILEKELRQEPKQTLQSPSSTHISEALHLTAERLHRRSLVVIFTDALLKPDDHDPVMDSLRHLRHCKHEVIFFHTLHHGQEIDFDYPNRPTEFIDLESGKHLKLLPSEVAERYHEQMVKQTSDIKQHAIRYRIDYQPIDIQLGFKQVLLPFLLKRSRHV